jgi:thiaminase/transcriptional activator TenA
MTLEPQDASGSRPIDRNEGGLVGEKVTGRLWASIDGTFKAILDHPFIGGLTSGSLEREAFRFYVVQDALYLRDYARALAVCASRSPGEESIKMFCDHAAGAIAVERALHERFFAAFGMSEREVRSTPMAPTNLAYTSYLLASAYGGSFPEALGAVLPCYWIYREVGRVLVPQGSPDALYRTWIETYAGEEFGEVVAAVLALADDVGSRLSAGEEERMTERFKATARYEWMFWDMGYRREAWPV